MIRSSSSQGGLLVVKFGHVSPPIPIGHKYHRLYSQLAVYVSWKNKRPCQHLVATDEASTTGCRHSATYTHSQQTVIR
jgi:hypothetical protein